MKDNNGGDKIIFALDVHGIEEIDYWAGLLSGKVGMFKVGKELFTSCGPQAVKAIQRHGGRVFLDLKYHDIPNTVARAMVEAARLAVDLVNLHALGGAEMMETAVNAVHQECGGTARPRLLAVTILTSSTAETLRQVGINDSVQDMVVRLAVLAQASGMDGVVASPLEIGLIRAACGPDFLIVTPGVRPSFAAVDDQKRIMSPRDAMQAGADYLVIGRPISSAVDPVRAVELIADEVREGTP